MKKIVEYSSTTEDDWMDYDRLKINGKEIISVGPLYECPEDAVIGRDLVSSYEVWELMQKAYNAGKNGQEWEFVNLGPIPPEEYFE